MNEPKLELKLYVVGQRSPDPDDWVGGYCLVIASSDVEAVALCGDAVDEVACQVECDRPEMLSRYDPVYQW